MIALMLAASVAAATLPPGARYVAMGSSFAAGPGVGGPAARESGDGACARSLENYPHLVAARLSLKLVDVTCSGAKTGDLRRGWRGLAAQVDAVTAETGLVTITVGGNDVGYIGGLGAASCAAVRPVRACPAADTAPPDWAALDAELTGLIADIRARAPAARIVLVDYLTLLPPREACARIPLVPAAAERTRATAWRLNNTIARVARRTGARLLPAAALSAGHHACAAEPWVSGLIDARGAIERVPLHPNERGMAGVADALITALTSPQKERP